jgi:DNA-binding NarL/FixJ family response regulator
MMADCLEGLAAAIAAEGHAERALRFAGAATTLREHVGSLLLPPQRAALQQRLAPARRRLSAAAAEAAWQAGRALAPQQAVVKALDYAPVGRDPTDPLENALNLTTREREVVALIAHGLSNRRIAESLTITEGTAHRHVANILGKLGLHSRSQVAAWAIERGLALAA